MKEKIFQTDKKESIRSIIERMFFNYYPSYRRTGGRIIFISKDWKEVHIMIKLNWKTRNYIGTLFGGCVYSALDPVYMAQLIKILGRNYVVWDKSAEIKYKKPIAKHVYARFLITDEILIHIVSTVKKENKCIIGLPVNIQDAEGIIYAEIKKVIYIADKEYYKKNKEIKDRKNNDSLICKENPDKS